MRDLARWLDALLEDLMEAAQLRNLLVLANPFKEGDLLVGGTRDDAVRDDARRALRAVTISQFRRNVLVDDGVTEALARFINRAQADSIDALTIHQLEQVLLSPDATAWVAKHRDGLPSEAIAAVTKVMTNDELSRVAQRVFNPISSDGIQIGSSNHFGSRIQPNSPGDNDEEILFSILEGLTYGCGDVIVGLNPASDELDSIERLEELLRRVVDRLRLPTRYCVLSDLVKQHHARARAPVDVAFQSLAGTSRALRGMVGLDVDGLLDLAHDFNGLYFETGQGSAVTNGVAEGVDMVTLEARAYGIARYLRRQTRAWMIVNDVAGFIGPEVFRTPDQLERACLEDTVMAKLHGLTIGLDVCATFHMGIAPPTLRALTRRIAERAAPAYLMAVAGNADPMLGYLTTSFREHPPLRRALQRPSTPAMSKRLNELGISVDDRTPPQRDATSQLYAAYAKAGGDTRTESALVDEGRRKLQQLRERGFELGFGSDTANFTSREAEARVDGIYEHARHALYATLDGGVLEDAWPNHVRVRTRAGGRDDYLAHPEQGEQLRSADAALVSHLYSARRPPDLQIVISDGLNANAINEHLRALLPAARKLLTSSGIDVGEIAVIIENGRVRAGYHVGQLVDATAVAHFIGERPGTGLNTVSAYLTYGRDHLGKPRFSPFLDHSATTAVCGIHPSGKAPAAAVEEIVRTVRRILELRRSGVGRAPEIGV